METPLPYPLFFLTLALAGSFPAGAAQLSALCESPEVLNEQDKLSEAGMECVRFLDQNKAPYQWQKLVTAGESATARGGLSIAGELVTDGESPGFVVEGGGKTQSCYASGMRESSKLQKAYWHASLKFVAVIIDGTFHHCTLTVKPGKNGPPPKKK